MSYAAELRAAVEFVRIQPPVERVPLAGHSHIADYTDTTELYFRGGENSPNIVTARSLDRDDLMELFAATITAIGVANPEAALREWASPQVTHELEHLRAAQALGARACQLGVDISRGPFNAQGNARLHATPLNILSDWRTTKLGLGLATAIPTELSNGDEVDLRSMGYAGRDDVFSRVRRSGEQNLLRLLP